MVAPDGCGLSRGELVRGVVLLAMLASVAGCPRHREADASDPPAQRVHPDREDGGHLHRFDDAEQWAQRFEDPHRDTWQRPDYVLELLALPPDAKVADIGAATGYFPVRFARAVPQGVVYGVDVEPAMVRYLAERAQKEGLANLKAIQCTPDDPRIPEPVNLIFICNTYHHFEDRVAYFSRLHEHLLPGGRLVIVDFYKRRLPVGPPPENKVDQSQVAREVTAAGFRVVKRDDELPYQYILVFELAEQNESE